MGVAYQILQHALKLYNVYILRILTQQRYKFLFIVLAQSKKVRHSEPVRTLAWESVSLRLLWRRVAPAVPQKMRIATPVKSVTGSQ